MMPEESPVKKLTLLIPEGSGRAGRPKLRWYQRLKKKSSRQRQMERSFDSGQGPKRAVMLLVVSLVSTAILKIEGNILMVLEVEIEGVIL